tara:strand:+ start:1026 stop:2087 length:1062 start_codon:yes stop_codon:yes gene_type:complete
LVFSLKIGEIEIGINKPPFVIAEAGANHNGSIELAFKLIEKAKEAGANCIKFQTFKTELFCEDNNKLYEYEVHGKKFVQSEFEMFKNLEFDIKEWERIIKCCKEKGIKFMTTIQDPEILDQMLDLGIDSIKVGSDDFDHLINLEYYIKSNLPLIISNGMSDLKETDLILNFLRKNNYSQKSCILYCVSLYPCNPKNINLEMIRDLSRIYPDFNWGFSDHTESYLTPALAVINGATVIEKHFTLDKDLPGPDHWFSVNPHEMRELIKSVQYAFQARGKGFAQERHDLTQREIMRRRIIFARNLPKGHNININDLRFRRASKGIFPSRIYEVIGRELNVDVKDGDFLDMNLLKNN